MRKMFSRDNIGPHAATQVPEEWPCCLDCDFIGTRFDGCVSSPVLVPVPTFARIICVREIII